jgi:hypothetical protein
MRSLLVLAAIGALWAIDVSAFKGRYSSAVWQDVNSRGQQLNYEVQRRLKKLSF